MKTNILLALCAFALTSCAALQEAVTVLNDRAPDGTYLPLNQVKHPVTGQTAIAKGSFYVFPDGKVGVTGAAGPSGPVAAPKFTLAK